MKSILGGENKSKIIHCEDGIDGSERILRHPFIVCRCHSQKMTKKTEKKAWHLPPESTETELCETPQVNPIGPHSIGDKEMLHCMTVDSQQKSWI